MEERELHPGFGFAPVVRLEDRLRLLIDTGLLLSSEHSLDAIVQAALDAGLALSGASLGVFFLHDTSGAGDPYRWFKTTGASPDAVRASRLPLPGELFAPAKAQIVRLEDLTRDPHLQQPDPSPSGASGIAPVRSLLAVPVCGGTGDLLGALVYGHTAVAAFAQECEPLVATVAAQAGMAIERAMLRENLQREMQQSEAARTEQRVTERRLRQALDANQLGTWFWDRNTGDVMLDDRGAALFGVAAEKPLNRDEIRNRVLHPDDRAGYPAELQKILEGGGNYQAEYRTVDAQGCVHWISSNGIPDLDEKTGLAKGMIGTVQDISARKQQEESLRQSEKLAATGRLAATIAHEINNPLEAVTNLIYLAKTDPLTPGPVRSQLETADAELARVAQIAQQTLGFYRDTSRPVNIDLNDLLAGVVDLFGRKIAGKRLRVTLDLDPGLSIVGLQGEIRQVVSNLLVNAIDASAPDAGPIRIRGRHRHRNGCRGVAVLISDRGSGIPQHVQTRLFTPFVTTKQSSGTGLGLWVTRGMVEKHGGSVRFRSCTRHPAGTVFGVFLPRHASNEIFRSQSSGVLQ